MSYSQLTGMRSTRYPLSGLGCGCAGGSAAPSLTGLGCGCHSGISGLGQTMLGTGSWVPLAMLTGVVGLALYSGGRVRRNRRRRHRRH
jgi:hypothetical protein